MAAGLNPKVALKPPQHEKANGIDRGIAE